MEEKHTGSRKPYFYCFSPPVMIATFTAETVLLLYTVVRYKMDTLSRLIITTLGLLAVFQLAEYQVCGHGSNMSAASRVGFMAIAMLPPISIHLVQTIAKKGWPLLQWVAHGFSASVVCFFVFSKTAFDSYACSGNYAIFHLVPNRGGEFFAYYYFFLILSIGLALYFAIDASQKVRSALIYQVFGVLSFLLPVGIINAVNPATINGIPSVMCGFAVIYAIVLVFGIAPLSLQTRKQVKPEGRIQSPDG